MMIKQQVQETISKALGVKDIKLLRPKDSSFGDYAVNIHQLDKGTTAVEKSVTSLSKNPFFEKVEIKGSFLNVFLSKQSLFDELSQISSSKDEYGSSRLEKKNLSLESGQPNTHKLPHIGHLFSYIYGESLARLLQAQGNTVKRHNYQGDVGLHVAKCLYVVRKSSSNMKKLKTLSEKVDFLQQCYQQGSQLYEDDDQAKKEIGDLNLKIYNRDPEIVEIWKLTRQWSIDYYKDFEKRLGISFDKYYFESETGEIGKKLVLQNVGKIYQKSDGAVIFRGEQYGSHTRVFVTRHGTPTYEAKDVGLAKMKLQDWNFDTAIITTASEQNEYWKVVKKAIELTLPELVGKITHIGFGMVDLKSGKMSSRTGNIISAIELVEMVKTAVRKEFSSSRTDNSVAEVITLGAIKYAFLKSQARNNISFDIKQSISLKGNSGPYLQYAYARAQSVIKGEKIGWGPASEVESNTEELALLRMFPRFAEVVQEAGQSYSPHLLATYLYDLAQKFSVFYEKHPILKAETGAVRDFRLSLTAATGQIIKNGLSLLGIEVLDKI